MGVPTGEFYVNKPAAYVIARVIIRKFMPGIDIDKYFKENVPQAWAEQDVNHEGRIEAGRIPMFLRKVVNSVEIGLNLQL